MSEKFYITTPIFYVNDKPHIGHAFTMIASDTLARSHRLAKQPTFFLTGTDEHGAKIVKAAEKSGLSVQKFTDTISDKFKELTRILNLSNDYFIRTADQQIHWPGVFQIWKTLEEKGDLYKGEYEGLYCVGHEAFLKKSDLKDGVCPDHLTEPEKIKEENYFFKLTKYKSDLKKAYEKGEIKIKPEGRLNEVFAMLEDLEDISFSRPAKDLKWGIDVPNDPNHKIYVWADALTNYLSAIGYGRNEEWKKWWPADAHVIGKDILKFHALIWPAMLLSVGLALPKNIFVHGFITVEGQKMSKTVGNVVDPITLVEKYGLDPVRYFLLREIPSGEDGDFSEEKLRQRYQSDLANGLGNLAQRVLTLIDNNLGGEINYLKRFEKSEVKEFIKSTEEKYRRHIEEFKLHEALANVFEIIGFANAYTNEHKPWELAVPVPKLNGPFGTKGRLDGAAGAKATSELGRPDHFLEVMTNLTLLITTTAFWIYPFLPETGEKVLESFGLSLQDKLENLDHQKLVIKKGEGLFPRLN